ncbi:hypothetical protein MERGE_000993 [Pneumocystis wakefieldiae]|uniref:Actin-related protein 2/3 complex subunit n=1 Tax=Pneumocystis wakefieldiae TaxID=38082 RepID=A0A899FXU1_9ASCO|nr:hypothetical protein MERGE_000993 [Pneumocystis wakefieldiae]
MANNVINILQLGAPVNAHAFNGAKNQVALSLNENSVEIYEDKGTGFNHKDTLIGHDKLVTSLDWAPRTNKIVTCSQDRNAYVWNLSQDGCWKPTLVLLRINRAATYVRWSPNEDKFAVASGAKIISICYFEKQNDWWVSKHIKKPIRSTVLSVDWHPANVLLASGSADMKARVFSAYIKDIDQRPEPTVWGSRLPFNTVCGEFSSISGGWVYEAKFSPSGNALAFTTHSSSITIVYPTGNENPPVIFTVNISQLPYVTLVWINEFEIIFAGYSCRLASFQGNINGWKFVREIDDCNLKSPTNDSESYTFSTLKNSFRDMDLKGNVEDMTMPTIHQNTITQLTLYENKSSIFLSSSGLDGKLVIWRL